MQRRGSDVSGWPAGAEEAIGGRSKGEVERERLCRGFFRERSLKYVEANLASIILAYRKEAKHATIKFNHSS